LTSPVRSWYSPLPPGSLLLPHPFLVRLTDVDRSPTFTDPRRRRPSGGPQDGALPPSGSPRRGCSNAPTLASWDAPVRPRASASAAVTTFSGTRKASSIFRAARTLRQRGIHLAARAPPVIHEGSSLSGEKFIQIQIWMFLQLGPFTFPFPNPGSSLLPGQCRVSFPGPRMSAAAGSTAWVRKIFPFSLFY
jgi:hypothetical protein